MNKDFYICCISATATAANAVKFILVLTKFTVYHVVFN